MGLNILICIDDQPNDALTQMVSTVEVYEKIDENTHYKLHFVVDVCDGDIAHSLQSATANGTILSVLAQTDNGLSCLVKGPVLQQESHLQHGGAGSWVKVEGEDFGYVMDHTAQFRVTDSGTDADIVTQLISSYPDMTADVEATASSTHDENNHSHVQRESNLSVIKTLARRNGYHFWITVDENGQSTGHFRSRSLTGTPTADLIVNAENNNIEALQLNADTRRPTQTVGLQVNLRNREIIGDNVSLDDPPLGADSLATAAGSTAQTVHLAPTVDDAGAMQIRSEAALRDAQWFINATCRTSVHRLCNKLIRFHTLVNMVGAGSRYNGAYYVTGVKHTIDAAAHVMELELARNAWGVEAVAANGLLASIF
jgi:phage protein D